MGQLDWETAGLQGGPATRQVCVTSPLLWLMCMEALNVIPGIKVSLYADVLAICLLGKDKLVLAAQMQNALDALST
jgi:hypothetical protein